MYILRSSGLPNGMAGGILLPLFLCSTQFCCTVHTANSYPLSLHLTQITVDTAPRTSGHTVGLPVDGRVLRATIPVTSNPAVTVSARWAGGAVRGILIQPFLSSSLHDHGQGLFYGVERRLILVFTYSYYNNKHNTLFNLLYIYNLDFLFII